MFSQILKLSATSVSNKTADLCQKIRAFPQANRLYLQNDSEYEINPEDFLFEERMTETPDVNELYLHDASGYEMHVKFINLERFVDDTEFNESELLSKIYNDIMVGQRCNVLYRQGKSFLVAFYGFCILPGYLVTFEEPWDLPLKIYCQNNDFIQEKILWKIAMTTLNSLQACQQVGVNGVCVHVGMFYFCGGQLKLNVGRKPRQMEFLDANNSFGANSIIGKLTTTIMKKANLNQIYDFKSEILSLGLTLLDLAENSDIETSDNIVARPNYILPNRLELLVNGNDLGWTPLMNAYSDDLKTIMAACLIPYGERITLANLLSSGIYKNYFDIIEIA